MTTYRNTGPDPLEVPGLALGRQVAPAGEEGDTFESDETIVHPLLEADGVNTAAAVDAAAAELPSPKPARKRTGGK